MAVPQPRILMFDITERSDGLSGFYTADYLLEDGSEVKNSGRKLISGTSGENRQEFPGQNWGVLSDWKEAI